MNVTEIKIITKHYHIISWNVRLIVAFYIFTMSPKDISNPGSEKSIDVSKVKIKETERKCSAPNTIPDGGWAWMVVFGSFMCNVVLGNILLYLFMMCYLHWILRPDTKYYNKGSFTN